MTIEIDDAGGGCTILGEVFVARRLETNEYKGIYVEKEDKVAKLLQLILSLQPTEGEEIHLCRGNEFDHFSRVLQQKGYVVKRIKVEGETNDLAEALFLDTLRTYGLPKSVVLEGKNYGKFYVQVNTWYETLYEGKALKSASNSKRKKKEMDFVINRVYKYPNLMSQLFYPETDEQTMPKRAIK